MIIRVYGDSLSLPRRGIGLSHPDTYPELLRSALGDVQLYNRSRGGVTLPVMAREMFEPDCTYFDREDETLLVLQLGVVDCAPRPIPRWLRGGISRLPPRLQKPVIGWLHDHRAALLGRGLAWRMTPPEVFAAVYRRLLEHARGRFRHTLCLNIAPTNPGIEAHSPGFGASIALYNTRLAELVGSLQAPEVELVDVHRLILEQPEGLDHFVCPEDGHHITAAGHQLYCRAILSHYVR